MTEYKLDIELLSDMCCGTGAGNGSNVDVNTALDEAGLPIIPAKRLKGLLLEKAEYLSRSPEYKEIKKIGENDVIELFGSGANKGLIHIDNAVIPDYEQIKRALISKKHTREEVAQTFVSYRAQTKIYGDEDIEKGKDKVEAGIAAKGSLRTTQIVNKGISFEAKITLENDKYGEFLCDCVNLLRHVGLNKTRGFGNVKCKISKIKTAEPKKYEYILSGKSVTVAYAIKTLGDIVTGCDYISGATVQALFAKMLAGDDKLINDIILNNTQFGNAYINGFAPVPLSLVQIKNKDSYYFNLADKFGKDDNEQYVGKSGYCKTDGNKIVFAAPKTAVEYHNSVKTNDLYAYEKICEGQTFGGAITADENAVELFKKAIDAVCGKVSIGTAISAGYGNCEFAFGDEIQDPIQNLGENVVLELLSDAVFIDENGNNYANPGDLVAAIRKFAEFGEYKIYAKTIVTGGYNAYRKLPNKQYNAFAKGAVIEFSDFKLTASVPKFLGIMSEMGYGQFIVRNQDINKNQFDKSNECAAISADNFESDKANYIIDKINFNARLSKTKEKALNDANTLSQKYQDISSSCAMRLLSLYQGISRKQKNVYEIMSQKIDQNFRGDSNKAIREFSNETINGAKDIDGITVTIDDKLFRAYIQTFISQIKRNYQKKAANNTMEGE